MRITREISQGGSRYGSALGETSPGGSVIPVEACGLRGPVTESKGFRAKIASALRSRSDSIATWRAAARRPRGTALAGAMIAPRSCPRPDAWKYAATASIRQTTRVE